MHNVLEYIGKKELENLDLDTEFNNAKSIESKI